MLRIRILIALSVVILIFLPMSLLGADAESNLWVTVGEDAFNTLRSSRAIGGPADLARLDARDGVVITRMAESDLPRFAETIHREHKRCGGFMVHASREAALEALRVHAQPSLRQPLGAPPSYVIDQPVWVRRLEDSLDEAKILANIRILSEDFVNRFYSDAAGENAAVWIRDLWRGYAEWRPEVTVELVEHTDWRQPSVMLTIPGTTRSEEIVVLGGHLDSVVWAGNQNPGFSAPGADDNASGIATLSEVIRVAMEEGFAPQRTVKFIGYAAEEVGLRGSQEIAGDHAAAGAQVVAVLQLDMTAYHGSPQDIALLSDFTDSTLTAFVGDLIDTYLTDLTRTSTACGYGCSDHAAWTAEGYPAAMPAESRLPDLNPNLHRTTDTLASLGDSAAHAFKFARLASAFTVELGRDAESAIFEDGFESGNTVAWSTAVP
ncbi:MAG: M20/M25/M40 family metallo-hydrolase [Acidobacteriota bacterium]